MVSDQKKEQILAKIIKSEQFKDRDLYQKLLSYLVSASIGGNTPKEVTIAHEVFHKGNDFIASEDTTVRVHIHHLRKLLEQYYQTTGNTDDIELFIPKGHYKVEFGKGIRPISAKKKFKQKYIFPLLCSALLVALSFILIDNIILPDASQYFDNISKNDDVWGEFFENEYPTSVVIGDFLVFHEYDEQLERPRRIQDYDINSVEELNEYIKLYPEKNIENWSIGELPHNSIYNISDIQKVLMSFKQKLDINFTSDIDINFIKNRNIIYIGEFKNLRALSDLMSILPAKYKTLPWWHGEITFNKDGSEVSLRTSHDWTINRYVVDLGIAAKLPGQNEENYLIIAGFGYNSQIKMVQILSKNNLLKELEDQIELLNDYVPDYFTIVFEVTGFDRASTKAEIKYFKEIDKTEYQNSFNSPH